MPSHGRARSSGVRGRAWAIALTITCYAGQPSSVRFARAVRPQTRTALRHRRHENIRRVLASSTSCAASQCVDRQGRRGLLPRLAKSLSTVVRDFGQLRCNLRAASGSWARLMTCSAVGYTAGGGARPSQNERTSLLIVKSVTLVRNDSHLANLKAWTTPSG